MAEFKSFPGENEATAVPVDWRRSVVEAAGYVFLAWAALVAINVYAFTDPAARSAAAGQLSHLPQILTHIPHNFALLFAVIFTLAAGIAPGDAVLRLFRLPYRDAFDRIAFGAVAGLGVLTALAYLLATVQLLRWEVEAVLLIVGFAASATAVRRWIAASPLQPDEVRTPRALVVVLWILLGLSLYVALLAALTPEVGFDARYYHLPQAERYAQHGGFYDLVASERMWAYAVPHYQETLYAFAWALFGMIGAKLIAWAGAVATVLALVAFTRAWFRSTAAGVLAATVLFASPVVAWSATTGNNDLAAVPFVILALHALLCWRESGSRANLYAAGTFAGITYGIKPFGAVTIVAIGVVAAVILLTRATPRRAALGDLARYAGCAVLALLPALISAQWMIGDPFYPLAAHLFSARYGAANVGSTVLASITLKGSGYANPIRLITLPWALTVDSLTFRNLVGPIWLAMLPLCVALPFAVKRGAGVIRPLAGFAAVFAAIIVVSGAVEFRYSESMLPAVALLIAYGVLCVDWRPARTLQMVMLACLVIFCALGNGLLIPLERNAQTISTMGAEYLNWDYIYGQLPDSAIQLQYAPTVQYLNAHLDPHRDKVYDGVKLQIFNLYSEIPLFNGSLSDGPAANNEWTLTSPDAYARLREAGCTYAEVPKETLPALKRSPLWPHLAFVAATPSMNGPTTEDELFKIQ